MTEESHLQHASAAEDTLSEDDAIFSESDGERLDYSGEESSSEAPKGRSHNGARRGGSPNNDGSEDGDGAEDEDEDEEDDESEAAETDEDETTTKRRLARETKRRAKRAKKAKRSRFIDTEAAVGDSSEEEEEPTRRGSRRRKNARDEDSHDDDDHDEEEEEEEEEDDDDDFVDNDIEERDKKFTAAFQKRLAAHAARREAARRAFEEETLNPEAVEERLRQLYGRPRRDVTGTAGEPATAATLATVMQPTSSDPKLWLVKCRPGRERAAVAALMRGLTILGDKGKGLGIYSVIGRDSLKGFIYVEAHKAGEVMNAVQQTKTNHLIFASPINRPVMVPLGEMADVLTISMGAGAGPTGTARSIDARQLVIGGWARVRRGKYAGDLAQIVEVEQDQGMGGDVVDYVVRVKLLPRLSFRRPAPPRARGGGAAAKGERPTARPFDPQEASQYGSVTKTRGFWIYNGEAYKDGFLHKDVRASSLLLTEVHPRLDELQHFGGLALEEGAAAAEDEDAGTDERTGKRGERGSATAATTALAAAAAMGALHKGEAIVVTRGEFARLTGAVESTSTAGEPTVLVRFHDGKSFPEPVLVSKRHLVRRFDTGDMVRVMHGEYAGRGGMIVSLAGGDKDAVVFTTGGDNQQFTVPLVYLMAASAASAGEAPPAPHRTGRPVGGAAAAASLGPSSVSFDLNELVAVEATGGEDVGLVTRLAEEEGQATILDMHGQTRTLPYAKLRRLPHVAALVPHGGGGPAAGRHDPSVLRAGDRVQFWEGMSSSSSPANPGGALARPATIINVHRQTAFLRAIDTGEVLTRPLSMISRPSAYGGGHESDRDRGRETRPPPQHRRPPPQRHLIGKSVTISGAGPYKGYVGIVKELTETMARVELHTDSRVVSVPRERVTLPGTGGERDQRPASGAGIGVGGMARPSAWSSSAAAATGSRTPAWGMAGSARTPAWGSGSGGAGAGSKTPAWGTSAAARTPAWGTSASGRTPAWGGSAAARTPAWGTSASARTPAVGEGGRTPAWQSVASARGASVGSGGGSSSSNIPLPAWVIPEAEVSLRTAGAMGARITAILAGGKVQLAGTSEPVSVADLAPVAPAKKDSVRIVGEERGATGTVIGLDGPDAVIRVDGTADFRIVPIQSLVKIARS